jgi:hypothetical protein
MAKSSRFFPFAAFHLAPAGSTDGLFSRRYPTRELGLQLTSFAAQNRANIHAAAEEPQLTSRRALMVEPFNAPMNRIATIWHGATFGSIAV